MRERNRRHKEKGKRQKAKPCFSFFLLPFSFQGLMFIVHRSSFIVKILLLLTLVLDVAGYGVGPVPLSLVAMVAVLGAFAFLPMVEASGGAALGKRTLVRPPWLHVAFLSALCLGLLPLAGAKLAGGLREIVQAAAVIGVAWVVFSSTSADECRWLRYGLAGICALLLVFSTITRTLCISLPLDRPSASVLAGAVSLLSGVLGAWNSVAGVVAKLLPVSDARLALIMALTLPFLIDLLLGRRDKRVLIPVTLILLLLGCRNGGLLLCGIAGGLLSIVLRERENAWQMIVAGVTPLCIVMIVMGGIPWQTLKTRHGRGEPCVRPCTIAVAPQTGEGVTRADAASAVRPYGAQPREGAVKRLYLEYKALPGAVAASPAFGHGLGQYKDIIHRYFVRFPDPADNKIVADTNSSYAVLAVEAGLPSAALLVLVLVSAAGGAVRAAVNDRELAAVAGSAFALPFAALFTTVISRNTGMAVACSMALAAVAAHRGAAVPAAKDYAGETPAPRCVFRAWLLRVAPFCILAVVCTIGSRFVSSPGSAANASATGQSNAAMGDSLIVDAAAAGSAEFILIEAEDTTAPPDGVMKISPANDASGNKVLDIPLEAGKGLGSAAYRLTAPAGSYTIWLRAFWTDGCSNSIGCAIAGKEVTVSDELLDEWHWLSSPVQVELPGGPADLSLKNLEDGIMIDQILLTRDPRFVPHGIVKKR